MFIVKLYERLDPKQNEEYMSLTQNTFLTIFL